MHKTTTLLLENFKLDMLIGIEEHDRHIPVPVSITARFTVNYGMTEHEDDVDNIISYADLRDIIIAQSQKGHLNLLETFAAELMTSFFKDERITEVTLKILKTAIFEDVEGAGIEVTQKR